MGLGNGDCGIRGTVYILYNGTDLTIWTWYTKLLVVVLSKRCQGPTRYHTVLGISEGECVVVSIRLSYLPILRT